jgi:hypothetical protein
MQEDSGDAQGTEIQAEPVQSPTAATFDYNEAE